MMSTWHSVALHLLTSPCLPQKHHLLGQTHVHTFRKQHAIFHLQGLIALQSSFMLQGVAICGMCNFLLGHVRELNTATHMSIASYISQRKA